MFRGKKYQESAKKIDKATLYDPKEGLELICKPASAKFDATVALHVTLGVDSRHADQQVCGASGMIAALTAAENGRSVVLLERQSRVGRIVLLGLPLFAV